MKRSRLLSLFSFVALPCIAAVGEPTGIGPQLRVSPDEQVAFVLQAQGVQVYACKPRAGETQAFAWSFVAPEATLLEGGTVVGRHFAGPTWESSSDRSSVKGAVRERQDGGTGNIPWLLLAATSNGADGKLGGVTSIQRVATKGGVEPTSPCTASNAAQEVRVPYTADYYFYKRK
jgi:hypothetical protein